jgi:DNA-directed RNA polymerase subunit E"
MKEQACRKCRTLTTDKACPNDGSTELSGEWSGLVIIINPDKSQVAKTLAITKPGRYALKVS